MLGPIEAVQTLLAKKAPMEALRLLQKSSGSDLPRSIFHSLRGDIFCHQLKFDMAVKEYGLSLEKDALFAPAYNGLGNALLELGKYIEAMSAFDRAVALAPDVGEFYFNRGQLKLLLGRWGEAFQDYERRLLSESFQSASTFRHRPAWRGERIDDKCILAYWEQGQGDTIQFVRYINQLSLRAANVVVEVQPSLLRLMRDSFPQVNVISADNLIPEFDMRVAITSLPWLFHETSDQVYAPEKYLSVQRTYELPISHAKGGLNVGIVWSGNPNHVNDAQRSMTFDTLLPIFEVPGVNYYSLQFGKDRKVSRELQRARVIDLSSNFSDFQDTAAAIIALDLVITVDTSVAHLAGALGKPVWVMLPFVPDWRWLLDRSDSPWYPSARLFRQKKKGDWREVIREISAGLVSLAEENVRNR